MWYHYVLLFLGAIVVDMLPILGPPAWTVMVFFQLQYHLDIVYVLLLGVAGSTIGRYLYSYYIARFAQRFLKKQKNEDMEYLGTKLQSDGWKFELFVFIYTLVPVSSTPLFSATGMARIKPLRVLIPFFFGKFFSDMAMVMMGDYAAANADEILTNFMTWKSILAISLGLVLLLAVFFVDWRTLLIRKKLRLHFNIFK